MHYRQNATKTVGGALSRFKMLSYNLVRINDMFDGPPTQKKVWYVFYEGIKTLSTASFS